MDKFVALFFSKSYQGTFQASISENSLGFAVSKNVRGSER